MQIQKSPKIKALLIISTTIGILRRGLKLWITLCKTLVEDDPKSLMGGVSP